MRCRSAGRIACGRRRRPSGKQLTKAPIDERRHMFGNRFRLHLRHPGRQRIVGALHEAARCKSTCFHGDRRRIGSLVGRESPPAAADEIG